MENEKDNKRSDGLTDEEAKKRARALRGLLPEARMLSKKDRHQMAVYRELCATVYELEFDHHTHKAGELTSKEKEESKKDKWFCKGMGCVVCGMRMGWYCPKSPDRVCHYDTINEDHCDFCGQPKERK